MTHRGDDDTYYTISGDFLGDAKCVASGIQSVVGLPIGSALSLYSLEGPIDIDSTAVIKGVKDICASFVDKSTMLQYYAPPFSLPMVPNILWKNMQMNCLRADAIGKISPSFFYDHRRTKSKSGTSSKGAYPVCDIFPSMLLFRFFGTILLDWKKIYISYMILASFRIGVMWKDRDDSCNMRIDKSDIVTLANTIKEVIAVEKITAKCLSPSELKSPLALGTIAKAVADELTHRAIIESSNPTGNWVFYCVPTANSEWADLSKSSLLLPDTTVNYRYYDTQTLRNIFGKG